MNRPTLSLPSNGGGFIADTPEKIRMVQLISAKHAIGLEAKGLRNSRLGQNGLKRAWAKHYGMNARSKHTEVIARIQEDIDKLYASMQQKLDL